MSQGPESSTGTAGLLMAVYVPTGLLAFGQGVMVPVLPLYAKEFGGSFSLAGIVVAAAWFGTMLADLPTGMFLQRIGYRRSMLIGSVIFSLATIALGLAHFIPELIAYRFAAGIGTALWALSRHAYIAQVVPPASRGKAISIFGGINRLGTFVGPFAGGLIAAAFGLGDAIVVAGIFAGLASAVAFIFVHDPPATGPRRASGHRFDIDTLREVINHSPRDVLAAGSAQIFGQMIRAGRQIVIPLYAAYGVGLNEARVGQVVSISALVDVTLFLPAGILMDRYGRKAAAIPSFAIMGIGMAIVPFTHSFNQLLIAGLVIGLGNGLGAGTMMTLGADLAPPGRTAEFLGVWRLIGDTGQAVAPMIVGAVADVIGIGMTSGGVSLLGFSSAFIIAAFVRETRWDAEAKHVAYTRGSDPGDPERAPPSTGPPGADSS
jgi:MFS family permease